jgi:S1-C subfamily serine protease
MKLFSTRIWITMILIPALALALQAQSSSVQIYKKYTDAQGKVVTEEISKTGDEAEDFDVEDFVDKNQGENLLELRIDKTDSKGNRSKIVINGDGAGDPNAKKEMRIIKKRGNGQSRGISDQPGEIIIMEGPDGLPLPENARKRSNRDIRIDIDTDMKDEEMKDDANRKMRLSIERDGKLEQMDIDLDPLQNAGENLEELVNEIREKIDRSNSDMKERLNNRGCNENKGFDNAYHYEMSSRNARQENEACMGFYPEQSSDRQGARVSGFTDYSPAEDAGMQENDIIREIDGQKVKDYATVVKSLEKFAEGDNVKVKFDRDGKAMDLVVRLKACNSNGEKNACIGVFSETYRQDDKKVGAKINNFPNTSPARSNGMNEGDIITAIDDIKVRSEAGLNYALKGYEPGTTVVVSFIRNGKSETKKIVLKDCNSVNNTTTMRSIVKNNCDENDAFLGVISSIMIESSGDETSREGESSEGFLISSVTPEGPAAKAGLLEGDIITSINGTPILTFDDLQAFMSKQKPGTNVDLRFLRSGKSEQRTIQLQSCKDVNSRQEVIISERGKGDRERRTVILKKPNEQPRVNQAPSEPIKSDDRSLSLQEFKAYPNPTAGKVTISFEAAAKPTMITILDLTGRQLFNEELNTFNGRYQQEFDLTEYGNATLIIKVVQGDLIYSDRIVVTK